MYTSSSVYVLSCRHCMDPAKREQRMKWSPGFIDPAYLRMAVAKNQTHTQLLSLLDVGVHIQERANGFVRGNVVPTSLVSDPLLDFSRDPMSAAEVASLIRDMWADARAGEDADQDDGGASDDSDEEACMQDAPSPRASRSPSPAPAPRSPTPDFSDEVMPDADRVAALLAINMQSNELVKRFLTLLEDPASHIPAAVLTQAVVSHVLEDLIKRGPLAHTQEHAQQVGVGMVQDVREGMRPRRAYYCNAALRPRAGAAGVHAPHLPPRLASPSPPPPPQPQHPAPELVERLRMLAQDAPHAHPLYEELSEGDPEEGWEGTGPAPDSDGESDSEDGSAAAAAVDDPAGVRSAPAAAPAVPLLTRPDFTPLAGGTDLRVSGEAGLTPMLFPNGHGFFQHERKGPGFTDYLLYRFSCPFTMFTLYMPYIMYMYAVRQQHVLAGHVQEQVLLRDIAKERKKSPDATTEDILRKIMRHRIPACMPGSPQYFQSSLRDLVCMVEHHGLPHLFLTLTEDEVSTSRWTEIDDLEACLTK